MSECPVCEDTTRQIPFIISDTYQRWYCKYCQKEYVIFDEEVYEVH